MFTKKIRHACSIILGCFTTLAVLIGATAFPTPALAFGATITVTTNSDVTLTDGQCSLREAITNANNNVPTYPDCGTGLAGSGDMIVFSSGLGSTTIDLGSTLSITDTTGLTIDGAGGITISGDTDNNGTGNVQIMSVGYNAPLTLSNLTLEKGSSTGSNWGGAITSMGSLTLHNDVMRSNTAAQDAGAINQAGGTLTITGSTFKDNTAITEAPAIRYSAGAMVIQDSTFQNNTTSGSSSTYGAIAGEGTLNMTIQRSTFDSNVAKYGGAVFFSSGTLLVENSTLYNNGKSGGLAGGIYASDGTVIIKNSTVADNLTNGIVLAPTVTLHIDNTILVNSSGFDCYSYAGATLGSATHNLIGTLPASPNNCGLTVTPITNLGLAALANNGGPTQTRALLAGSQAIDAGDNLTCLATDQRSDTRPLDGNADSTATCDIGAFEVRPATTTTITSDTPDPSMSGASVTVNVTVTSASGIPGGSVNISTPDSSCIATLSAGAGSCVLNPLAASVQTITASYPGDLSHDPSTGSGTHIVTTSTTFQSVNAQDGWILEASETSSRGATLNNTAPTFNLGDDAARKQYRAILSFGTGASLPDTAIITGVMLKVRKQGISGGGSPLTIFKGFMTDIKKGFFGTSASLQAGDFQATAGKSYGPFLPALAGSWYSIDLTNAGAYINKLTGAAGLTQIRLRFKLDDNNNTTANILRLYSGNAPASSRPQLVVTYYTP